MKQIFEKKLTVFRNRQDYVNELEFEFVFEMRNRKVKFTIEPVNCKQMSFRFTMHYIFDIWHYKEFCIAEGTKEDIDRCLNNKDLAQILVKIAVQCDYDIIQYDTEVSIPNGVIYLDKLIINPNYEQKHSEKEKTVSLKKYSHIGVLRIPASVRIVEYDDYSPFAGEGLRGFICAEPTPYKHIRIDRIDNNSPHLRVEKGILYSADMTQLIYCFEEKSQVVVPESITKICPYAFCGQRKLEKIDLPNGLQEIGNHAFIDCRLLNEICLPDGIKEIKYNTFDNCLSLEKIVLPNSITRLGRDAFRHCEALQNIDLPESIEYMCSFECCYKLQKITIPPKVKEIEGFKFCHSLQQVKLSKGVERIRDYAFRYCEKLEKINFPEGLQKIGIRAFMPNNKLTKVNFPSTLNEIGCEAFCDCRQLRTAYFHSNVKIDQAAFAGTSRLLRLCIRKPKNMNITKDVFIKNQALDKFGFWD